MTYDKFMKLCINTISNGACDDGLDTFVDVPDIYNLALYCSLLNDDISMSSFFFTINY